MLDIGSCSIALLFNRSKMEDSSSGCPSPDQTYLNMNGGNAAYTAASYSKNLLRMISVVRSNNFLTDLTLEVGDKTFSVHKLILASASPYFMAMFWSDFKESTADRIRLEEVSPEAMEVVVSFLYSGVVEVNEDIVHPLLRAAALMEIEDIVAACCKFLKANLTPQNCIGTMRAAKLYSFNDIYDYTFQYITEHFIEVVPTESFLKLTSSEVKSIISRDDIYVDSEISVFNALMHWVKNNVGPSEIVILSLLTTIRTQYLSPSFLTKQLSNDVLKRYPLCSDYLKQKSCELKFHKVPAVRNRIVKAYEVYLVGGDYCDSLEKFNPISGTCTSLGKLPCRRMNLGCVTIGGNLYAVGGNKSPDLDVYDPELKIWKSCCPMSVQRSKAGVVLLDDMIYACGGKSLNDHHLHSAEKYDYELDCWIPIAPMMVDRFGSSAVVVNRRIYVIGGKNCNGSLSSCERYTPETDSWEPIEPIPKGRHSAAAVTFHEFVYVIGGLQNDGDPTSSVFKYNTNTGVWSQCSTMPYAAYNLTGCTLGDRIYVLGGDTTWGEEFLSTAVYNIHSDTWERGKNLPSAHASHASCIVTAKPFQF